MLWLKFFSKLIKILNEGATPGQIAGGIALGAVVGLMPSFLINLFLVFLILIIDVNLSAAFFSIAVFKILAYPLDPLANSIGYELLVNAGRLKPLWTALYNMPAVPFTRFNNTVVLGSFIISLVLFLPLFFLSARGVRLYREKFRQRVMESKLYKFVKLSGIYQFYAKARDFNFMK